MLGMDGHGGRPCFTEDLDAPRSVCSAWGDLAAASVRRFVQSRDPASHEKPAAASIWRAQTICMSDGDTDGFGNCGYVRDGAILGGVSAGSRDDRDGGCKCFDGVLRTVIHLRQVVWDPAPAELGPAAPSTWRRDNISGDRPEISLTRL